MIDTNKIEQAVRDILEALGDDPNRAGLVETPKRVAKMYQEVFEGMNYTNEEIAAKFDKCFYDEGADDLVTVSKIARVADMVGKRLQLQERIGEDIADILQMILNTQDIIVVVQGEHSCMTARGIKSRGSQTRTATVRGKFKTNTELRKEAYELFK